MRKSLSFHTLVAAYALLGFASFQGQDEEGFISLFNGKDLSNFKTVLSNKKENVDTFTVENDAICVSGKPIGCIYTEKSYKNYVFRFDYSCEKGYGGCVVHIASVEGTFPKSLQFELTDNPGHFIGFGMRGSFTTDREAVKKAAVKREKDKWNNVEIISKDGEFTVKINGVQVTTGKTNSATEGPIGFLSEVAGRCLYKNIRIKEIP